MNAINWYVEKMLAIGPTFVLKYQKILVDRNYLFNSANNFSFNLT